MVEEVNQSGYSQCAHHEKEVKDLKVGEEGRPATHECVCLNRIFVPMMLLVKIHDLLPFDIQLSIRQFSH